MIEIKFPIYKIEGNKFLVNISLDLYVKEAITATCYKFTDLFYIHQMPSAENKNLIEVIFESKDDNDISVDVPKHFCNELLEQQIRYNTNQQFARIRDMIVEEAFKPINK